MGLFPEVQKPGVREVPEMESLGREINREKKSRLFT